MKLFTGLRRRWHDFMHNEELKQKIYKVVFESDTPQGKLFDIILMCIIVLSVLLVIMESMHIFPHSAYLVLRVLEYLLTFIFTIEYLARVYCLRRPSKYIFSFFGIVDLLATLPVYLSFFPAWVALSAGHTCLPSDTYIPSVQAFHVHQRRKSASALIVDKCS